MVLRPGDHPDSPIGIVPRRVGGNIPYRVLVANVTRNALAKLHHLIELVREESLATGRPGQAGESPRIPVRIVFVEDADGVNNGTRLLRQLQNLLQTCLAGVVASVADD